MNDYTIINTIRHGETDYNLQKRYAGTIDVPLSENGRRDTIEASQKLDGRCFDLVISSTLKRSVETTHLLLGNDISFIRCELCNERNYGRMQGLTSTEVEFIKPKIKYIKAGGDFHSLNPPDGESFRDVRMRAKRFYDLIFDNYRGLNLLVVSHGAFLQQFHGFLQDKNWVQSLEIWIKNLEYNTFQFKGSRLLNVESTSLVDRKQNNW